MGTGIALTGEEISELRALLALKAIRGLGDRAIRKVVEEAGSATLALRARRTQLDLAEPKPSDPPITSWLGDGFVVLPMTSSRYPESLLKLSDPPPVLFLEGRAELLSEPAVAIVGSRRASEVGRRAAETMGRVLSGAGVTVVSGLALGIDGAAHRGAVSGPGNTMAVLGSGFRKPYPAGHRRLAREVAEKGLLVSEFLPDEPALPHHFPKRNRVIAALSWAIIVVEAGRRSGALITVDHGLDLGREILALPGSVENRQAEGSNALLREGATVIADPEDVLEDLVQAGFPWKGPKDPASEGRESEASVRPELRSIWEALGSDPRTVEEISRLAGVSVSHALRGLFDLELGEQVRQCPGMRFRRW